MMLLNMALVWLMMYFSICLMIIVLKWYFEITFISRKKGLCWPSFLILLTFWYQVSTICYNIFDAHRFDMLYDYRLQMSRTKFSYTKLFSSGILEEIYWRKYVVFYIFRVEKPPALVKVQTENRMFI